MTRYRPARGDVLRYAYLWADEHERGREEGRKERPSLVLAVAVTDTEGLTDVLAVAITHTPPRSADDGVILPLDVKRELGLDDLPSWIVTREANKFTWPGPDVRPVPDRPTGTMTYGRVPYPLLREVVKSYLANRDRARLRVVRRTE